MNPVNVNGQVLSNMDKARFDKPNVLYDLLKNALLTRRYLTVLNL